jgi:pimeloyl-ACP methyl ester carboxylesterase
MKRWRGVKQLVHDAVDATTALVEEGHESTSRAVMRVLDQIEPVAAPAHAVDDIRRFTTRGVLATVRAVNRAVEVITDVGFDAAEHAVKMRGLPLEGAAVPMRSDALRTARGLGDAAMGVVNGAIGDHLHTRGNGLDLGMQLRYGDGYLDLDDASAAQRQLAGATPRVVVLVHGLMLTEWSWCLEAEAYHGDAGISFGSLLARDLGFTPIYARYNTGRHVSENGRSLARTLAALQAAYPMPIEELVLIGHSMGGLVIRSACHYAAEESLGWLAPLRRVFCLGSPHHGAPLERIGRVAAAVLDAIDTPGTRIPARLIQARSSGIKDLGKGRLVDEDWLDHDPDVLREEACREVPLLDHVAYHFLSATMTEDPEHPLGKIIGDLLVLSPSACGEQLGHRTFPIDTRCFGGVLHHQLQNHPAVYEQIRRAIAGESGDPQ